MILFINLQSIVLVVFDYIFIMLSELRPSITIVKEIGTKALSTVFMGFGDE